MNDYRRRPRTTRGRLERLDPENIIVWSILLASCSLVLTYVGLILAHFIHN